VEIWGEKGLKESSLTLAVPVPHYLKPETTTGISSLADRLIDDMKNNINFKLYPKLLTF
jgi:hypothetical protein